MRKPRPHPKDLAPEALLSTAQAAVLLNTSANRVKELVASAELRALRWSTRGDLRIPKLAVTRYVERLCNPLTEGELNMRAVLEDRPGNARPRGGRRK